MIGDSYDNWIKVEDLQCDCNWCEGRDNCFSSHNSTYSYAHYWNSLPPPPLFWMHISPPLETPACTQTHIPRHPVCLIAFVHKCLYMPSFNYSQELTLVQQRSWEGFPCEEMNVCMCKNACGCLVTVTHMLTPVPPHSERCRRELSPSAGTATDWDHQTDNCRDDSGVHTQLNKQINVFKICDDDSSTMWSSPKRAYAYAYAF